MNESQAIGYLSKLLNREVTAQDTLSLTSGQRARFISWAEQFGRLSVDQRGVMSGSFNLRQLLGAVDTNAVTVPAAFRQGAAAAVSDSPLRAPVGVGIDIQRIAEIVPYGDAFDFRSAADLTKIFSEREISYACARSSPTQTLAGLFAAKEAIIKADPALASQELWQIEILPDAAGAPARAGFQLSISHSGEYAVAMVLKVEAASAPPQAEVPAVLVPRLERTDEVSAESPGTRYVAKLAWMTVLVFIAVVTGVLWWRHR